MEEFTDKTLACIDCGASFVWGAGSQQFFADKGLKNEPKRCPPCKQAKSERFAAAESGTRVEVKVICAQCGQQTTVPFYPSQGKPVYCRACFLAGKAASE